MLASPAPAGTHDRLLRSPDLVFEPKYDGIRALVALDDTAPPRIYTRLGRDKTAQFPEVVEPLATLGLRLRRPVLLDGEIVATGEAGTALPFQHLQERLHATGSAVRAAARHVATALVVFDMLRDGDEDLRPLPFTERRRRLERSTWSMSLFVLYFGTDRDYRDQVVHHSVLFGPRYRELLADIFHGDRLPEDFSLYLHAPHVTDPSLAPPGGGAFYVLAPVPHLGNAELPWAEIAGPYADRILAALERVLPDLRAHVVLRRWMTPLDFRSDLNAYCGSAFSLAPTLTQSAWFRMHNRDPRIPNLYLVGAGTHPGAGIPGVLNSARATVDLVLADLAP